MNWNWLIARRGIPKAASAIDDAIEKPKPKEFATPVGVGFVDDFGVWHAREQDAERATAARLMINGTSKCTHGDYGGQFFWAGEFAEFLDKADTIRAMAILGQA